MGSASHLTPRAMVETGFEIYQTARGYVAVTNATRRQILEALAQHDLQLPELVELTQKAKPTLSSVHMKALLGEDLIAELPHPNDKRKKIYRLVARRIGSSALPLDQLRSAVQHYVSLSPLAARLPLTVTFEALSAAPPTTDPAVLHAQSRRLGELSASLFERQARARDLVTAVAGLLEREGLATPLKLDLEALSIELEIGGSLPKEAPPARLIALLCGFVEGVMTGRGTILATSHDAKNGRRFRIDLTMRQG